MDGSIYVYKLNRYVFVDDDDNDFPSASPGRVNKWCIRSGVITHGVLYTDRPYTISGVKNKRAKKKYTDKILGRIEEEKTFFNCIYLNV